MEVSAKGKGRQEDPKTSTRGDRGLDKARLNVKGKPSREGRTPQSQPNGKDKYP